MPFLVHVTPTFPIYFGGALLIIVAFYLMASVGRRRQLEIEKRAMGPERRKSVGCEEKDSDKRSEERDHDEHDPPHQMVRFEGAYQTEHAPKGKEDHADGSWEIPLFQEHKNSGDAPKNNQRRPDYLEGSGDRSAGCQWRL